MIGRNDPCFCGSGLKWKKCHAPELPAHDPQLLERQYLKQYGIRLKNEEQIEGIRRACRLAAQVLEETCALAKEGITTIALNDYAHERFLKAGAIPATLNYGTPPYPRSICVSLNEVICHGIADSRPLEEGDILNIDVACVLDGFYGDCSKMATIGKIDAEKQLVVDVARESLRRSINILKPGVMVSEIGEVIEEYAVSQGCSVVYEFVAHGVGLAFHEPPQIPHCRNRVQIPLAPGMIFTIEPMINAGVPEGVIDLEDGWTVRTADGRASAQEEHTVLITPEGFEVLTVPGHSAS